jgi:GNAT superfamily N-acetyltransferase
MPPLVRPARLSDAGAIVRLTSQLGYDADPSELKERLARILTRSDQRFLVAEVDGRPVGWLHAAVWEVIETAAFVVIGGLVVDRAHRGRGIGRLLMEHAESWARTQHCSIVRLWSTSSRTRAHRFYEGLGHTKVKTQYSFARALDPSAGVSALVPRVEEE